MILIVQLGPRMKQREEKQSQKRAQHLRGEQRKRRKARQISFLNLTLPHTLTACGGSMVSATFFIQTQSCEFYP